MANNLGVNRYKTLSIDKRINMKRCITRLPKSITTKMPITLMGKAIFICGWHASLLKYKI